MKPFIIKLTFIFSAMNLIISNTFALVFIALIFVQARCESSYDFLKHKNDLIQCLIKADVHYYIINYDDSRTPTFKSDFNNNFNKWESEIYNYDEHKSVTKNIFKRHFVDSICPEIVNGKPSQVDDLNICDQLITECCDKFIENQRDPLLERQNHVTQMLNSIRKNFSNISISSSRIFKG
ncbi:uncharacterized protein LOC126900453 isoform X2 [Daktulosphaira vitifoliae]|uniref:uncharacterized protein LOC126900453 isoform X2 n=1 Tax=Daktulosphaira vitifoliae TaxID=58002 RepID=UPI0021AADB7A|nr:uncharacterized protein LOC126900453 isoform X2 [Daktulosphaira vitifoliae]